MIGIPRIGALAGALVLAIVLGACSSDEGPNCAGNPNGPGCPPPPPPPPTTVTETVVIYGDNGSFPAESVGYIPFSIPGPGTVAATVDWTFASSMVATALTTDACDDAEAAFLGQCAHIAAPNISRTQKPKTVSGTVGQAGGARLWVINLSTDDEAMAVQVTLTRTRTASAPFVPQRSEWAILRGANALKAVRAMQAPE